MSVVGTDRLVGENKAADGRLKIPETLSHAAVWLVQTELNIKIY